MVVEGTNVGSKHSSSKSSHKKHIFGGFNGQLGASGMILLPAPESKSKWYPKMVDVDNLRNASSILPRFSSLQLGLKLEKSQEPGERAELSRGMKEN